MKSIVETVLTLLEWLAGAREGVIGQHRQQKVWLKARKSNSRHKFLIPGKGIKGNGGNGIEHREVDEFHKKNLLRVNKTGRENSTRDLGGKGAHRCIY